MHTNALCCLRVCVCMCTGVCVCVRASSAGRLKEAPAKGNSAQRFCSNKLIVLCGAHKQESSVRGEWEEERGEKGKRREEQAEVEAEDRR